MIDANALDGVLISSPHSTHYAQARYALERELHVLIEKPLTTKVRHAQALVDLAAERARVLVISYQRHFYPAYAYVRELVQKGAIGELKGVVAYVTQNWGGRGRRMVPELAGGGMFMDTGSHLVAAELWMTGLTPVKVSAFMDKRGKRVDMDAVVNARFRGGALGSLSFIGSASRHDERLSIHGDKGTLVFHLHQWQVREVLLNGEPLVVPKRMKEDTPDAAFLRWIRNGGKGYERPDFAVAVAKFTEAAYRVAGAEMIAYAPLVGELDQQIEGVLTRQVLDAENPYCGGFIDRDRLVGSQSISAVASLGYAYLLPESRHYRSEMLVQRILLAAAFARRQRNPSGCFDLLTTNFDSAPDTGFVVQAIAPVVFAARQQATDDAGAAAIAEALGELIQTGAPGMVAGGFHTPNHRWVLVAALAQAQALYPELAVSETVDAYLGEGIDVNADGEYSERSTGVYNAVVNRALIRAAQVLDRPDLLEPVRRNLDWSYHLLHADATAVTSISTRQDRDTRAVPTGLADGYHALAHLDGHGFYAAVADWLVACGGSGLVCLPNYVLHPEWRTTCDRADAFAPKL